MASRLYDIINTMILRKNKVTYQMPTMSAGAAGYFTVPHSFGITNIASKVIAIRVSSGSIADLNGIQLFPIAISDTDIYIEYYAPRALSLRYTITVLVTTTLV